MSKSIEAVCDANRVRLEMFGEKPIFIDRPPTVSVAEWQEFWGHVPARGNDTIRNAFTKDDVAGNNDRRRAFMEEEALRHELEGRN